MLKLELYRLSFVTSFPSQFGFQKFHLQSEARFRQQLILCFRHKIRLFHSVISYFYLKASFINDSFLTEVTIVCLLRLQEFLSKTGHACVSFEALYRYKGFVYLSNTNSPFRNGA
jgi:hypothetical protein